MNAAIRRHITGLELLAMIVLGVLVFGLFWTQKLDSDSRHLDSQRKQDISALYYYLENTYYPLHHGYPATLDEASLKGLDASYLKDPEGKKVNERDGDFAYLPTSCQDGVCAAYKLTGALEKEAAFTKTSVVH